MNCFLALSKYLNYSEASLSLELSPRSLNRNIHEIENALGINLFIPQGRDKVILSTEGLALLRLLQPLARQMDELETLFLDLTHPDSQKLSFGWCSAWPIELVPKLVDKLYEEFDDFCPQIQRLNWAYQVEQLLLDGQLDLGLSCREPRQKNISWIAGRGIPYVIVGKPQKPCHWDELRYVTGIQNEIGGFHGPWDERRYPRKVVMQTEAISPLLDLITGGEAAAWLPFCLVSEFIQKQQLAILADPPRPQHLSPYLIWRTEHNAPPIQLRARALLLKFIEHDLSR